MGQRRHFHCEGCHMTATVSGGPDRGMTVFTETRYCPQCEALHDVTTGPAPDVYLSDDPPQEQQQEEGSEHFDVCPSCKSSNLTVWTDVDPCPRCGGVIICDGISSILWD